MFNLSLIKNKIIVSCQPENQDPYYDLTYIAKMLQATEMGGAGGVRLNGPYTIKAMRPKTALPIVGLWKQKSADSDVYITPNLAHALEIIDAGADIVALDATARKRPQGESIYDIMGELTQKDVCLMGDISTLKEGVVAETVGFHCISTTLSGYTDYSSHQEEPDFKLLEQLCNTVKLPVILEGRIWNPEHVKKAFKLGAHAVVIGSAITRPHLITERFVRAAEHI